MNTVVARILRVLSGQSPIAMVHAIDELGHEHKLELPAATVRGVTPGHLLVLQWSTHAPPALEGPLPEVAPVTEAARVGAPVPEAIAATSGPATDLESLLGLPRGRPNS
jgi:hypothetical protein